MTAADAAWTINTTIKYAAGATAVQATALNHAKRATAPNSTTLVVRYELRSGTRSGSSRGMPIVPRHVWEPYEKKQKGGKALKTYRPEGKLPMVTGGAYTVKQYEKKGTTVFIPDPNFYGPKSNADAVALTFYTNSDSMIADLRRGNLDWIDQVPFTAVNAVKKSKGVKVNQWPGGEITNITWNSNPRKLKNRELLDPRVKKALSMCVNRDKMIQVVFAATRRRSRASSGTSRRSRTRISGRRSTTAAPRTRRSTSSATSAAPAGFASLRRRAASTRRPPTR